MRLSIVLFLLLLLNQTSAQSTPELQKVDSIIQHFENPNSPGFSIGIVENGKLIYCKGIGYANMEERTNNSGSSIFGIASIAKQFTAACIWSLIKENKISLDDDLRKYIPEFPSYGKPILIRHMLNHTSGIRNYHAIMELAGFDYDHEYHDNQTILELACRQKGLNNIPGEKVIYGNTAYTLLALIVERISGQNLNEYAQDKIFRPLNMYHTFYRTDTSSVILNRSFGYIQNDDGSFDKVTNNQITYGAGSVGSSVEDLVIWSDVLNGLNPDFIDLKTFLTTVEKLPSGESVKYARGVMVDEYKNKKTIHHSGFGQGGQSQIMAIPELRLAIIILTNSPLIDPSPLSYQILDIFLPTEDSTNQNTIATFHHNKRKLKRYAGEYKEQHSDMKMEILLDNDTLKSLGSQGKKAISLIQVDKTKFTRNNNQNVLYDFEHNKSTGSDLTVYFGGTPFYFSRATFADKESIVLTDYVGQYYSKELSVEYEIAIENGILIVNYPNHPRTKLFPGQKDEFGNGQRVLYHFERNKVNEINRLILSAEGTVKDIEFINR